MSGLRYAVHVAPPIPFRGGGPSATWSPISCTLIYTDTHAVLVDTPITIQQTNELLEWINRIAPRRQLSYVYITHGHGDHWFGLPVILKKFPSAKAVATKGTLQHMYDQTTDAGFAAYRAMFPNQIARPFVFAEALGDENVFSFQNHALRAVLCGHTDTYDSTVLWVPDLRLAVCGDAVYGSCHQMLAEANTKELRAEWVSAIGRVESLDPIYVVPGHRRAEEADGTWHLAATKKYIQDFDDVVSKGPISAKELVNAMVKRYPERFNLGALIMSATSTVRALKAADTLRKL